MMWKTASRSRQSTDLIPKISDPQFSMGLKKTIENWGLNIFNHIQDATTSQSRSPKHPPQPRHVAIYNYSELI